MKRWFALIPVVGFTVLAAAPEPESKVDPAHEVRTWTAADGRTLQAELLEFSDQQVKVRRQSDGKVFEIPLDNLSGDDNRMIVAMVRDRKRSNGLTQGLFAEQITGQFAPGKSKEGLNFQLYGNPQWDGTKRYPLVVWLHGAGQSGDDNTSQLAGHPKPWFTPEAQEKRPCFGLAPQCPSREIGWKEGPAQNVVALIGDLIENLPIDEARVYLTGSSMGGSGTWHMLARWPTIFACGVPLCGSADVKTADALKEMPIWVFHGAKDDQVPVERSRAMAEALKALGGRIMYTELEGQGHLITGVVYEKPVLQEWMFLQRKNGGSPPPAP